MVDILPQLRGTLHLMTVMNRFITVLRRDERRTSVLVGKQILYLTFNLSTEKQKTSPCLLINNSLKLSIALQ